MADYAAEYLAKRLANDGSGLDDLPLVEAPQVVLPRARYRFADGTIVTIRGIALMLILGVQSEAGKPEPPVRLVKMAGGGVQRVPRGDDEPVLSDVEIARIKDPEKQKDERDYAHYRQALAEWVNERNTRMARLLFLVGVEDSPPPEIADLWKQMGFQSEMDIKFNWLASKLPDAKSMEHFFNTVTSLTVPSEDGLDRAEAMFQSGVQRGAGALAATQQIPGASDAQAEAQEQAQTPTGNTDVTFAG